MARPVLAVMRGFQTLEWVGVALLFAVVFFVLVFPVLSPYDPNAVDTLSRFAPPGPEHLMGTDNLGRDVATRLAVGGRLSLATALAVVLGAALVGTLVGAISALIGGWTDGVIMRVCDVIQAFPMVLLALIISYSLGGGMPAIATAIILAWWPYYAKVTRGLVLGIRDTAFVDAARAQGANRLQLLRRHIVPHTVPTVLTQLTIGFGEVIIVVGGLSLIGLGAKEPTPEWGSILAESVDYIFRAWWVPLACGLAITLTSIGANLLGDALRNLYSNGTRIAGSSKN